MARLRHYLSLEVPIICEYEYSVQSGFGDVGLILVICEIIVIIVRCLVKQTRL